MQHIWPQYRRLLEGARANGHPEMDKIRPGHRPNLERAPANGRPELGEN